MSDEREESPLFGRLSWPEPRPEAQVPPEPDRDLEKERARAERAAAKQDGTPVGLLTARRVVAAVWLSVCLIQVMIWGLVWIIGGSFPFPWWLYTVGGGGVIVGVLWLVSNSAVRKRGTDK